MNAIDPQQLSLLVISDEPGVFDDYLTYVANAEGLARYKTVFQYGNKQGESLWTHIVNMVCVLETLQPLTQLDDTEARVMYTAVTVHDINKMRQEQQSFGKLARQPIITKVIEEIGFDEFFPDWHDYLPDIEELIRAHSGHYRTDGDGLIAKSAARYRLDGNRIEALKHLIRAADVIDLSHSLDERAHKSDFLGHLNSYLAASGDPRQYRFFTHQIVEQRGLLTNVLHNALIESFRETYRLISVLLYPDGVVYLGERELELQTSEQEIVRLGETIASRIKSIVAGDVETLIEPTKDGYKIKPDAFLVGASLDQLWREIRNQIARRRFKADEYDQKARDGAIREIGKKRQKQPEYGIELLQRLEHPAPIVAATEEQFRSAELARAYFWFLKTHFDMGDQDPWRYIYTLLELPEENWNFYDHFNSVNHRLYVLAGDIALSEDEVYARTLADGQHLPGERTGVSESDSRVWIEYVRRYVLINGHPLMSGGWQDHLAHYMANQHHQCVYCNGPFKTNLWMSADVRDGIKVQKFSYRLEGGSSREPKKYICEACRTQFLLEVINYPPVRGENTIYLHLFPYSFYPAPFVNGLRATFNRLRTSDFAVQALNLNTAVVPELTAGNIVSPVFSAETKAGKPHPYGVYVPTYSETVGGALLFPINAPSDNTTDRFLFALWYALVLQRHFGVKVLVSESPVPPLDLQTIPDLYLDNIPLGCSGFLARNDYRIFDTSENKNGPLHDLWRAVENLFALDHFIFGEDVKVEIVRAMASGPLAVFHAMDRLLLKHDKEWWIGRQAFPYIRDLALTLGGEWMAELSRYLENAAALAWQNGIRGRTLKRSSLLFPLDEVFGKLTRWGGPLDRETLIAATVQDIFTHLERLADEQYKPGRTKLRAVEEFVRLWYDGVLDQVYGGSMQRLLNDEKTLRSAYLFFVQAQIPQRSADTQTQGDEE